MIRTSGKTYLRPEQTMDIKLIIICQYFFIGFKKYIPPVLEVNDI